MRYIGAGLALFSGYSLGLFIGLALSYPDDKHIDSIILWPLTLPIYLVKWSIKFLIFVAKTIYKAIVS